MELKSAISSVFLHAEKHLRPSPNQKLQPVPFLLTGNNSGKFFGREQFLTKKPHELNKALLKK